MQKIKIASNTNEAPEIKVVKYEYKKISRGEGKTEK